MKEPKTLNCPVKQANDAEKLTSAKPRAFTRSIGWQTVNICPSSHSPDVLGWHLLHNVFRSKNRFQVQPCGLNLVRLANFQGSSLGIAFPNRFAIHWVHGDICVSVCDYKVSVNSSLKLTLYISSAVSALWPLSASLQALDGSSSPPISLFFQPQAFIHTSRISSQAKSTLPL